MSWLDRLLGRQRGADGVATTAAAARGERIAVDALHADGAWRRVELLVDAARVSDALNGARLDQLDARDADGASVDLESILLIMPPAHAAGDPSRRLHRPPHQLWVRMGECAIVGSLHLPPGAVGSAYLLRRNHRFFVLTEATIRRPLRVGREERLARVLLVNLQQVSSLRDTPETEVAPAVQASL